MKTSTSHAQKVVEQNTIPINKKNQLDEKGMKIEERWGPEEKRGALFSLSNAKKVRRKCEESEKKGIGKQVTTSAVTQINLIGQL